MARKRAESMDQASFWALNAAGEPEKVCRPTLASTQSGAMLDFSPALEFIWGVSATRAPAAFWTASCELAEASLGTE